MSISVLPVWRHTGPKRIQKQGFFFFPNKGEQKNKNRRLVPENLKITSGG